MHNVYKRKVRVSPYYFSIACHWCALVTSISSEKQSHTPPAHVSILTNPLPWWGARARICCNFPVPPLHPKHHVRNWHANPLPPLPRQAPRQKTTAQCIAKYPQPRSTQGLMFAKSIHNNKSEQTKPSSNVWSGKPAKEMAQSCIQQIFERIWDRHILI